MIERLGGAKGVDPNLEQLADEGIFFSRIFANSFRTDRGTVCTFSAFPGLPTLSLMKVPSLCQTLPNIAHTLGKAGYSTDFLYGGDINFTNTQGYLRAGGFEKLTSQDDFSMADRNYSKWGVPDHITFNHLFDMLKARENNKKPWFTAFLTLSSHEPFEVPLTSLRTSTLTPLLIPTTALASLSNASDRPRNGTTPSSSCCPTTASPTPKMASASVRNSSVYP